MQFGPHSVARDTTNAVMLIDTWQNVKPGAGPVVTSGMQPMQAGLVLALQPEPTQFPAGFSTTHPEAAHSFAVLVGTVWQSVAEPARVPSNMPLVAPDAGLNNGEGNCGRNFRGVLVILNFISLSLLIMTCTV